MPVILESTASVVLESYGDLKAAVAQWLHRNDLASVIPTFIGLAEAKLNRRLRVAEMEQVMTPTDIVDGAITKPEGWLEWKSLWVENPNSTITAKTSEWIRAQPSSNDRPRYYAREADTFVFWPGAGTVEGVYFRRFDGLSADSESNWLLDTAPDLYLFAALEQSAPYIKADERLPMWQAKVEELIQTLNGVDKASQLSGGQLVARAR